MAFRNAVSATDAEALLVAFPVQVLSTEKETPPTFVVQDAGELHAIPLSAALLAEPDIGYAAPNGL